MIVFLHHLTTNHLAEQCAPKGKRQNRRMKGRIRCIHINVHTRTTVGTEKWTIGKSGKRRMKAMCWRGCERKKQNTEKKNEEIKQVAGREEQKKKIFFPASYFIWLVIMIDILISLNWVLWCNVGHCRCSALCAQRGPRRRMTNNIREMHNMDIRRLNIIPRELLNDLNRNCSYLHST